VDNSDSDVYLETRVSSDGPSCHSLLSAFDHPNSSAVVLNGVLLPHSYASAWRDV
jgi:hypothetical protein